MSATTVVENGVPLEGAGDGRGSAHSYGIVHTTGDTLTDEPQARDGSSAEFAAVEMPQPARRLRGRRGVRLSWRFYQACWQVAPQPGASLAVTCSSDMKVGGAVMAAVNRI
jgi:hypothetical protein